MREWGWRAFLALTPIAATAHFVVPGRASMVVFTADVALVLLAVVCGVVLHRPAHRRTWYLLIAALGLLVVVNVVYTVQLLASDPLAPLGESPTDAVGALGVVLLLAAALSMVLAGTQGARGGVLDAAVMAVAGGAVVWGFLVYPNVAGTGAATRTAYLVQVLCLMGVAGALVRVVIVSPSFRVPAGFFAAAVGCNLVSGVGYLLTHDAGVFVAQTWTDPLAYATNGFLGAAALHPAMTRLGSDRLVVQERLHDGRLLALTAALLCAPLVVGASAALGRGTDTVLLVTSLLVMVPLVMARIRGLVQEREAAQAALAHQATHDALTGLLNRAELLARLDAARERVAMGVSPGLCLIFLDLDGFKQVNDTFGHAAGDLLLKVVAERVRECVRAGDAVARLGGDEFVVLWEQADAQHAQVLADRLDAALRRPVELDAGSARIGASIGMVIGLGPSIEDGAALLSTADASMYRAKRASRQLREAGAVTL